jgi:hypothetical protein
MGAIVRTGFARATTNVLVAAVLAALGTGVGVASASAATIQTGCSGLQAALNGAASSGGTIVLSGMCSGSYMISKGAAFTLEGTPGTTSGFDGGAGVTGPLLGTAGTEEAGAMTFSHLTFEHAKNVSALSIDASRVTLSGDSFLENEEQGTSEHAAFVDVGQSPSNCPPTTGPPAITLTGSTFSRNKLVLGSGQGGGAGAWLEDTCEPSRNVVEGNTFEGNTLEAAGTAKDLEVTGGGLQFVGAQKQPTPVSQSGNVFDSNRIVATPPALGNYGGGGEWLEDASLLSVGDSFSLNTIAGTSTELESAWSWGAGLGVDNFDLPCSGQPLAESTLEDAIVTRNAIGPGYNVALGGGGIYVACTHLRVLDSTFTLNTAPNGAGIEGEPNNDQLELANSIVAEDSGGNEIAGFNEPTAGGSLTASFSDVCAYAGSSEPLTGAGNICANPLLADNGEPVSFDVHETAASPTIDAGSNALVPEGLTTDFYGTPRILAGYASCSQSFPAVVDMGAAEFQPAQPSCPETITPTTGLTVQAPTTGPTVQKQAPAPGLTHFVSLELDSTGIALRLSCSSTDGQGCSGAIFITSDETLKDKKVVAVGASNRTAASVRIGQASFSLPAGATATFRVKLNSTGLELLHHFHAVSAWVLANEAMPSDSQVIFLLHDARFSEPKQKHKKSKHKPKNHHG